MTQHIDATAGARAPLLPSKDISGKVLTKRPTGPQTILALTYPDHEAAALRRIAAGVVLKKDRKASLSLIARRALVLYEQAFHLDTKGETAALDRMVTPVPKPAAKSKKPRPGADADRSE